EILGGYNPLKWNTNAQDKSDKVIKKDTWSRTKDSFIFNLTPKILENPGGKKINDTYVLSRVQNPGYAFFYSSKLGPNFGDFDLKMSNNFKKSKGTSCRQVNYEKPIRKSTEPFMIDEYEIFQICPRT
ncbi:14110_t:CDS:2, partial [Dentiscutata erythropus]